MGTEDNVWPELNRRLVGSGIYPDRSLNKYYVHPPTTNPQGSQNLWKIEHGLKTIVDGKLRNTDEIIAVLKNEKENGNWNSEQMSPIYWPYHVVGLACIAQAGNQELYDLCKESVGSFFWYAKEMRLGPEKKIHLVGMRGTGHGSATSDELDFLYRFFSEGRGDWKKVKGYKKYWKDISGYGFMHAACKKDGALYSFFKDAFEWMSFRDSYIWPLKVPTYFVRGRYMDYYVSAVLLKEDINGNTPAIMGAIDSSYLSRPSARSENFGHSSLKHIIEISPTNYMTRIRQRPSKAKLSWSIEKDMVVFKVDNPLYDKEVAGGNTTVLRLELPARIWNISYDGMEEILNKKTVPSPNPPELDGSPEVIVSGGGPRKVYRPWWKKVLDWLGELFYMYG